MTVSDGKSWERWNTHFSTTVEQEVFGHPFKLAQDPNSQHLGTTVWDSSIVLAKYLEKNARRGEFARHKMRGKRAAELGAGMGLGGLAFAMLGADVLLTDVAAVLPLLRRNYENNLSPAVLRAMGSDWAGNVGAVAVAELDWAVPEHAAAAGGPFDVVMAADCVYHEEVVRDFLRTVLAIVDHRSTVVVVNELRSDSVHARFLELFGPHFVMRKVPRAKMDAVHQHPAIDIFLLKLRRQRPGSPAAAPAGDTVQGPEAAQNESALLPAADGGAACDGRDAAHHEGVGQRNAQDNIDGQRVAVPASERDGNVALPDAVPPDSPVAHASQPGGYVAPEDTAAGSQDSRAVHRPGSCTDSVPVGAATTWQTRRQGAEAARLLASVHLPVDERNGFV